MLSQQNIFESNLVDDYITKFFVKINFNNYYIAKFYDLKIPIIINVYKKKNKKYFFHKFSKIKLVIKVNK